MEIASVLVPESNPHIPGLLLPKAFFLKKNKLQLFTKINVKLSQKGVITSLKRSLNARQTIEQITFFGENIAKNISVS